MCFQIDGAMLLAMLNQNGVTFDYAISSLVKATLFKIYHFGYFKFGL